MARPSPPVLVDDACRAEAEGMLRRAQVTLGGSVVGTVAACDPEPPDANYRECFVRDFAVSAAAWLQQMEPTSVGAFVRTVAEVQARYGADGGMRPPAGLMPASFTVHREEAVDGVVETVEADFDQRAIGRVAPVDAALWWLLILHAHVRACGDTALARSDSVRGAMERVLSLYLRPQFEMLPSLLVPDGSAMIDRRMGVYGHPLDVQVLFWAALRAGHELLEPEHPMQARLRDRIIALGRHLRRDYRLDQARVERIRRFPIEEFGPTPRNPWNLTPDAIPTWTMVWLREGGGYFAGNLGPARIDVRFFALGNLLAVSTGLATQSQVRDLFDLIERHEKELLGATGMKLTYPPLKGRDWSTVTGSDQKNVAWSYHNGGTWPMLLWPLASAARVAGRAALAERVLSEAAPRLRGDGWPEYYDGPHGGFVGRRARRQQTWTAAAVLAAAALLQDPSADDVFAFGQDAELEAAITAPEGMPA